MTRSEAKKFALYLVACDLSALLGTDPSLAKHPQVKALHLRAVKVEEVEPAPVEPPTRADLVAYEEAYQPGGALTQRENGACHAVQDLVAEVRRLQVEVMRLRALRNTVLIPILPKEDANRATRRRGR